MALGIYHVLQTVQQIRSQRALALRHNANAVRPRIVEVSSRHLTDYFLKAVAGT